MKTTVFFLTMLALFLGCNDTAKEGNANNTELKELENNENLRKFHSSLEDYPDLIKVTSVDTLIAGMIQSNCVYDKNSGIVGDLKYEYACFERLCQILDEEEMFNLVEYPNPTIRVYAYKGLKKKNSILAEQAREKLKEDNSRVWTLSGATKTNIKISELMKDKPMNRLQSLVSSD